MPRFNLLIAGILLLVISTAVSAQLKTESFSVGFGGGVLLGDTEFGRDDRINPYGSVFLRHAIFDRIEGQVTGNFLGKLKKDANEPYETTIYSADYSLLVRLVSGNVFSPYVYGGVGGLYYDVTDAPPSASATAENQKWKLVAPVGGGFQIGLSDYVSIDVAGGYNFTNTDDLNFVDVNKNDGYFNGRAGLTIKLQTGTMDKDKDGLNDREERKLGTNPNIADSDTDGLNDGEEFMQYRTHPLRIDTDNDGLNDMQEVRVYSTDPRDRDSDKDGLSDAEEVFTFKTNPLETDSDGDGVNDREEVMVYRSNPNDKDSDKDGLEDGTEITKYRTDPTKPDTDNDRLSDKEEVNNSNTDPLNPDTDGDGLTDGDELLSHNTDPLSVDTDNGGVDDFTEVKRKTDPLDGEDDDLLKVGKVGDKVVLDGILFATGRANISPQSEVILEKAYQTLVSYPDMDVEIHGFTDNTGNYNTNITLSQKRAEAVRRYLISRGIDPARLVAKGFGPANPIAPNNTKDGRARNRRIEFVRTR